MSQDHTEQLRSRLEKLNIVSFKQLSQIAGVSEWQVKQLRQGKLTQMRVEPLQKLSQALGMELEELLNEFSQPATPGTVNPRTDGEIIALRQEYQRLRTELDQQKQQLQTEFQLACLRILESWLIQFPTAAYQAQQKPELSASKLLPLMRPIEQLLKTWGVESIAPVGTELPYNPQEHQLMGGTAQPGDPVQVRYTGYRQGEKLLYRAQVSPVANL